MMPDPFDPEEPMITDSGPAYPKKKATDVGNVENSVSLFGSLNQFFQPYTRKSELTRDVAQLVGYPVILPIGAAITALAASITLTFTLALPLAPVVSIPAGFIHGALLRKNQQGENRIANNKLLNALGMGAIGAGSFFLINTVAFVATALASVALTLASLAMLCLAAAAPLVFTPLILSRGLATAASKIIPENPDPAPASPQI